MQSHTKTKAGLRTLPLLPILAAALPKGRIGLIFHEPDGAPFKMATIARVWREYCVNVGLVEQDSMGKAVYPVTPHCFRHTFATICYDAGLDAKSTADMMGHADETLTMQIYTHLNSAHRKSAAEKLIEFVAAEK